MTTYKRGGASYLRDSAKKRGTDAKAAIGTAPKYNKPAIASRYEDKSSIAGSKKREAGRSPSYLKKPR